MRYIDYESFRSIVFDMLTIKINHYSVIKHVLLSTVVSSVLFLSACHHIPEHDVQASDRVLPSEPLTGKLTPPHGKTLVMMGQDIDTVSSFVKQSGVNPAGLTAYVSADGTGAFSRMDIPQGNLDLQAYLNNFPDSTLALGLWMVGSEERMANPEDELRQRFIKVLNLLKHSNRPIYMRLGYEADGPWNHYEPEPYIATWRFVATWIKENNADNIALVWHIANYCGLPQYGPNTYKGLDYEQWWPGQEYVDWIGVSYFSQNEDCVPENKNTGGLPPEYGSLYDMSDDRSLALDNIMDYVISKNKPVLIAESTPVRYHLGNMTYKQTPAVDVNDIISKSADEVWNQWYQPYFDFIEKYRNTIRAVSYINMEWDQFSAWTCDPSRKISQLNCSEGYWGNANILLNTTIKERFFKKVNSAPYLFHAKDQSFSDYSQWSNDL